MIDRAKLLDAVKNGEQWLERELEKTYNIDARPRFITLLEHFGKRYPHLREVTVLRAPGRVNLIGEHTDYNGLPVMPMAIDYDMLVALSPRDDNLVRAVNPDYPDREFAVEDQIQPFDQGDWGNYVKAGVQGIVDEYGGADRLRGFDACFYGTVPVGGGLSSSSTLVVASAMSLLESSALSLEPQALAERMASAEWYVGTQGGGMDHAACILSERGKALKIDFFPLRSEPVALPEGFTIVVANSMVTATKTREARMHYNKLPASCRAAAAMIARHLGMEESGVERLGDIYYGIGREKTLRALEEAFTHEHYSKRDIADFLGSTVAEVDREYYTTKSGELVPEPQGGFRIAARARHVITETVRVEESVEAIRAGNGHVFGQKMMGSMASCRYDYEISHPALDEICDIAMSAGSTGSRLTGAGFGGCTVHLVEDERVNRVSSAIERCYYGQGIKKHLEAQLRYEKHPETALLALRPSGGARVLF